MAPAKIWGCVVRPWAAASPFREGCNGDQCQDSQHTFHQHCTVGYRQHVALTLDLLGCGSGGYQRVEAGNGTAGNGNKQDREQVLPSTLNPVKASRLRDGLDTNTPTTAPTIMKISR